jgi:hypothetical protein
MITIFENKGEWNLSKTIKEDDAILQECLEIIKLYLNDAFWDEKSGINYNLYIGMDKTNIALINLFKNEVEKQLYKVNGIERVVDIELEFIEKKLKIKFNVLTINNLEKFGEVII